MGNGNAAAVTEQPAFSHNCYGQSCCSGDLSVGVRLGCMLTEILVTQMARDSSQQDRQREEAEECLTLGTGIYLRCEQRQPSE